jgi:superfamily II DNA or RNA helicase
MLNKLEYPETLEYSSDGTHLPIEFFLLTVPSCKRIDLKLGYFSSNAIRTLAYGFAQFIYNGGHLRIITNHFLSYEDKMLFAADKESGNAVFENEIKNLIEHDLEGLAEILKKGDLHFFNCLRFLLKSNRLQLIPVKLKPDKLAHYKQGIMDDGTNQVYFSGSCNFTYKGLIENGESLGIARSWGEHSEKIKIQENALSIDRICKKEDTSFEYLLADQIIEVILTKGQDRNLDELIEEELDICDQLIKHPKLAKSFNNYTKSFKLRVELEKQKILEESQRPRFPYPEGPREYQQTAFENWRNNNQQGLFAMATGTGKTITSLNCLLEIYKKTGYYKALILVPTITLVNQWEDECKKFKFNSIVKVCSKSDWKSDFSTILTRERLLPTDQVSYVVISTYASFTRPNIFAELNQLPVKTLLIADECHNMGSGTLLKLLPKINCKRRIGLSATPERQYDEEGNKKLFSFFNNENGYTYEYSMAEAINKDVLCRYYYYPHLVSLTDSEMNKYLELSLKIAKYFNPQKGSFDKNDSILTNLLLARKRIIHKAHNKIGIFSDILSEHFSKKKNLKYTLVYVPEGNDPNDYFETDIYNEKDVTEIDNDAVHLIDVFTIAVKQVDKRTTVKKFISGTNSKDDILEQFAKGEIDVLTSMKCLDEGVDVPRAELAIFCASTGNPRQFIQRRGRILRRHREKQFAYIHDLVVIPEVNSDSNSFNMERSLLKKELERVNNFASLSENSAYTVNVLLDIMNYYNLNLYNNE